ncbi:cob(I)yrinic acid a,c-diamide adenosyltransferase [Prevotella fusca]
MIVYTKAGDKGTTSLCGGKRVSKDDIRVEAYGTLDELNAEIGVLTSLLQADSINKTVFPTAGLFSFLQEIQEELFVIGGELAVDKVRPAEVVSVSQLTEKIEASIDKMESQLPEQHHFVLPGGTLAASQCHVCRTVCRRAERRIVSLSTHTAVSSEQLAFINRLSDYFFILSRYLNNNGNISEKIWEKTCR